MSYEPDHEAERIRNDATKDRMKVCIELLQNKDFPAELHAMAVKELKVYLSREITIQDGDHG